MSNKPLPENGVCLRLVARNESEAHATNYSFPESGADDFLERGEQVRYWLAERGYSIDKYLSKNFKRYYLELPKLTGLCYCELWGESCQ